MTEQRRPDVAQSRTDAPNTDRFAAQDPPNVPEQASSPKADPAKAQVPASPAPALAPAPTDHYQKVRRTKFSGLWVGITVAAIVLLVLLVFIIENGQSVDVGFFGAHWHTPLGVTMLLVAICGILLVAIPGYGRIIQLRRMLRKTAKPAQRTPEK